MASRIEIRMKYKAETANAVENSIAYAHIGKYGDVICEDSLNDKSMESIRDHGFFEQTDPDYVAWLEEKLMDLL